jgi:hypothetical protein
VDGFGSCSILFRKSYLSVSGQFRDSSGKALKITESLSKLSRILVSSFIDLVLTLEVKRLKPDPCITVF